MADPSGDRSILVNTGSITHRLHLYSSSLHTSQSLLRDPVQYFQPSSNKIAVKPHQLYTMYQDRRKHSIEARDYVYLKVAELSP